jgi:hypothetical protein
MFDQIYKNIFYLKKNAKCSEISRTYRERRVTGQLPFFFLLFLLSLLLFLSHMYSSSFTTPSHFPCIVEHGSSKSRTYRSFIILPFRERQHKVQLSTLSYLTIFFQLWIQVEKYHQ